MGFNYGAGSTVNINGNVSMFQDNLVQNGTLIIRSDSTTGSGTKTLYTVTAGKTLYITSIVVSAKFGTTSGASILVQTDADGTTRTIVPFQAEGTTSGSPSHVSVNFNIPLKIPATKIITAVLSASYSTSWGVSIIGYEI